MRAEWVYWCFRYPEGQRVLLRDRPQLVGTVVEHHIQNFYVRDRWIKVPVYLVRWDHLAGDDVTDCRYAEECEVAAA